MPEAQKTQKRSIRYGYLGQQFSDPTEILNRLRDLVASGDFTLGKPVAEFESCFAELIGSRYAIGVGSGTDALKLPLKALNIGPGDEVITAANTFIATVGAINEVGATPRFVDCDDSFCMDVNQVGAAITDRTKALMPVHFTGEAVNMSALMAIADRHDLPVIEDACQGILAESEPGRRVGLWGVAGGFSLHPLKNLNVWGDAGVIVTNSEEMNRKLRLLRNHGLADRDTIEVMGYNSRLDSVQAIVGNWLIGDTHMITDQRIANAAYYDQAFAKISGIQLPPRRAGVKRVYHLYIIFAENRNALYDYCIEHGISVKIHYPVPVYAQPGLAHFGYRQGDFPVTDRHAACIISFPVDQHISRDEQDYVIETVRRFYDGS